MACSILLFKEPPPPQLFVTLIFCSFPFNPPWWPPRLILPPCPHAWTRRPCGSFFLCHVSGQGHPRHQFVSRGSNSQSGCASCVHENRVDVWGSDRELQTGFHSGAFRERRNQAVSYNTWLGGGAKGFPQPGLEKRLLSWRRMK